MLSMTTLYERLLEICRDQGIERPIGRDIQRLAGLSSGRVTQIKQEREAAKLGSESLQRLTGLGYFADWLQEGRGPKCSDARTPSPLAKGDEFLSRRRPEPLRNPEVSRALFDLARELERGDLSDEARQLLTSELQAKTRFVREALERMTKKDT